VAVIHKVPCNTCQHCLKGNHSSCDTSRSTNFDPGGFSEYIRVPEINVDRGTFPVPNNVSFEEATFFEPLSCAVRAQRKMGIHPGETVLIAGSGIAGLLHIKLAKANGAGKIFASDINDYRLEKARELGAIPIKAMEDIPARIRESNNGFLADKIIVCTGAKSALLQAFKSVERGGTILLFAVPRPDEDVIVPLNDFWTSEIRIMTSYYTSPQDMRSAIKLIESGRVRVDDMITHRLPLDEIQKGFDLVSQGKESIKVIIEPHTSF
jgi:L-iditol 2-dehydrogenase